MTREEYETRALEFFPSPLIKYLRFTHLLEKLAVELFAQGDITSEMAVETRRRLMELDKTGRTE